VGKEKQIRLVAEAVIRRVLMEVGGIAEGPVMRAVDAAYPFGQRRGRAYQIWRDETRRALSQERGSGAAA
jgi:hypothetical protein